MEFDRFFKFSQLLLRDEFVLSYSGYVSEDILLAVGDTLCTRLEDHARDCVQIRNVFSIFGSIAPECTWMISPLSQSMIRKRPCESAETSRKLSKDA